MTNLNNVASETNMSSEKFVDSLDKNLKLLRKDLLDETVLRTPSNYNQRKLDLDINLNLIYPNLSKEQRESIALVLKDNGELNLLDMENLKLLDQDFMQKNKLLPNKISNQIGEALGTIVNYIGITMLAISPLDSSLFIPGAILTGVGFTVQTVCQDNLDERNTIVGDYEKTEDFSDDLGLNQNIDMVGKEKTTEKNDNAKVNLLLEKSNLDKKHDL